MLQNAPLSRSMESLPSRVCTNKTTPRAAVISSVSAQVIAMAGDGSMGIAQPALESGSPSSPRHERVAQKRTRQANHRKDAA
ncbi:MAG: hypothetical protein ACHQ06_06845 [Candidatus Dormibacteria bacterium]